MKAVVLHELGKVPRHGEFAEPIAGKDEVIVRVRAASLKSVDRQLAGGTHYASPRELPVVCGTDGVGELEDGTRVFFGGARRPYGAMAERTVVPSAFCFSVPAGINDETAAALPNPGVSAWLTLAHRAKLAPGETVLILGATGVTGQLALQIAKLLGAKRVIGAGRNERMLRGCANWARTRRSSSTSQANPSKMRLFARRRSLDSTSSLITCGGTLRRCCSRRLQNRNSHL